jgi:hypothetical protein
MLDTKGPEVRSGDLVEPIDMAPGDELTFTIEEGANGAGKRWDECGVGLGLELVGFELKLTTRTRPRQHLGQLRRLH